MQLKRESGSRVAREWLIIRVKVYDCIVLVSTYPRLTPV